MDPQLQHTLSRHESQMITRRHRRKPEDRDLDFAEAHHIAVALLPTNGDASFGRYSTAGFMELRALQMAVLYKIYDAKHTPHVRSIFSTFKVRLRKGGRLMIGGHGGCIMQRDLSQRVELGERGRAFNGLKHKYLIDTALDMDLAISQTVQDRYAATSGLDLPDIYTGFPLDFELQPDHRAPMQWAMVRAFADDLSLPHLASPGGKVASVCQQDGFNVVEFETGYSHTYMRVPVWCELLPRTTVGTILPLGTPFAVLPQRNFSSPAALSGFSRITLDWLQKAILAAYTRRVDLTLKEARRDGTGYDWHQSTLNILPVDLVPPFLHDKAKQFADLRGQVGRSLAQDDLRTLPDEWDAFQGHIHVLTVDPYPKDQALVWQAPDGVVVCDLSTVSQSGGWLLAARDGKELNHGRHECHRADDCADVGEAQALAVGA